MSPGRHLWTVLLFLALSALSTALSWLFYYRAIQAGPVAAVAAIDKGNIVVTALVAALFAAAPADLFLVAAVQASLPATLLRRAKSRLPLCVRVLLPLWPECAAGQCPLL